MKKVKSAGFGRRLVGVGLLTRILTDTTTQMFFAFLPILAAGVGVTPVVFGRFLSVRSSSGLLTPLFGNLAERRGFRVTLPLILLLTAVGIFVLVSAPSIPIVVAAIFLMGLGSNTFQPMLAAYSSATLAPERRARGMGIIEYGWALSSIIGLYVVGRILDVADWRVPLIGLGIGLGIASVVFFFLLRNQPDLDDTPPISLWEQFNVTENRRGALAAVLTQGLITFAGLHTFTAYSIWLFNEHAFDAVRLGSIALGYGLIDLVGSGLVSASLDKIGRKEALIYGGAGAAIVFGLLGWFNSFGLVPALIMLFLGRFLFEFTIVTGVITTSEQSPNQRSRVMSLLGVVGTLIGAWSGFTGPLAYETFGLVGLGVPSAVAFGVVALLAWLFIE